MCPRGQAFIICSNALKKLLKVIDHPFEQFAYPFEKNGIHSNDLLIRSKKNSIHWNGLPLQAKKFTTRLNDCNICSNS